MHSRMDMQLNQGFDPYRDDAEARCEREQCIVPGVQPFDLDTECMTFTLRHECCNEDEFLDAIDVAAKIIEKKIRRFVAHVEALADELDRELAAAVEDEVGCELIIDQI